MWWKHVTGGYTFRDGDDDEDSHSEGLLHYRSATIKDVTERQSATWMKLLNEKVELPTPKVYLYNAEGNPTGELTYPLQHSTGSPQDSTN